MKIYYSNLVELAVYFQMLAEAIALTKTMSCEQVIKDDDGNEVSNTTTIRQFVNLENILDIKKCNVSKVIGSSFNITVVFV